MRRGTILVALLAAIAVLAGIIVLEISTSSEVLPITHTPTFIGNPVYILGSGSVVQNGSAYSYVRINASAISYGDSFTVYPAINVPLTEVKENNLTATIIYRGSSFGSSPYWLNFSAMIPVIHFSANSSQSGISSNFMRSAFPLQNNALFFSQ